jgi:hypothetical protein
MQYVKAVIPHNGISQTDKIYGLRPDISEFTMRFIVMVHYNSSHNLLSLNMHHADHKIECLGISVF